MLESFLTALKLALAGYENTKPLPKGLPQYLDFPTDTPSGTEKYLLIEPDTGYELFAVRLFEITTPLEVAGNIIISKPWDPVDEPANGDKLINSGDSTYAYDLVPNTSDHAVDAGDFYPFWIFADKIWLYGRATTLTTADRQAILKMYGLQFKKKL